MRGRGIIIILDLFVALCVILQTAPSSKAEERWMNNVWSYEQIAADPGVFAKWVSEECGPKDASGIQGIIIQSGVFARYTIFVWCRVDRPGSKWVRKDWLARDANWRDSVGSAISKGGAFLVGQVLGSEISIVTLEKAP
jgi:hypothetical protein